MYYDSYKLSSIAATHKSTNDRRKSKSSTKYHTTGGLRRDQASKNVYYRFSVFVVIIIRQRKEYSRKCCNLSRRNLSRHCIRPTWHSKHFRKPAKKKLEEKIICKREVFFLYAIMLVIRYYWMMKFCLSFLNMLRINMVQTLNFHKSLVKFFALHRICYNAMRNI